jgi:hypothetical protein
MCKTFTSESGNGKGFNAISDNAGAKRSVLQPENKCAQNKIAVSLSVDQQFRQEIA